MRGIRSPLAPGGSGTTMWIGLLGNVSAEAAPANRIKRERHHDGFPEGHLDLSLLLPLDTSSDTITLRQRTVSALRKAPTWSGVPPTGVRVISRHFCSISGSRRISANVRDSRSAICRGVFGGATTANQLVDTTLGIGLGDCCAQVEQLGRALLRW